MGKIECPGCHKFIEDDTPERLAEAVKPLAEAVKSLPGQFPKPTELPLKLMETLETVAQAGQHMESTAKAWEAQKQAEAEATDKVMAHPAPTQKLIEHWHACTDCAPAWTKIYDGIVTAARKDYVPTSETRAAITEVARQLMAGRKGA